MPLWQMRKKTKTSEPDPVQHEPPSGVRPACRSRTRLFLSCVSDEFHKPDPDGQQRFLSYRDDLAEGLRQARFEVVTQEDFAQGFGDLLQTLDDEVRECHRHRPPYRRYGGRLPDCR